MEKGLITDIVFYGDFLSVRPLDELTEALKGCPYRSVDVGAVLDRFPLAELFGGIQRDEVLDVLFHIDA
ncbi:hypothetical protein SDC9_203785 [bioreactor metagenome]|uniref:lipoate--protein ligase n=1 Tax=bioreactor metagenome TaxID=1076179 RepID=A0A645J052_9ZZZZ